jgi:sec-independent protein translocase protein TatA
MGGLSPFHIILLVAVVLLVFGSKRLAHLGKDLGTAIRGFRDSVTKEEQEEPPPRPDLAHASDDEVTEALVHDVGPQAATRAKQAVPAPTPEIADAQIAEAERANRHAEEGRSPSQ